MPKGYARERPDVFGDLLFRAGKGPGSMAESLLPQSFEIGVSYRYAQEHDWVVHAITGFLSAYYMEDPRFRVVRRVHELETGMFVWKCEAPSEKFVRKLLRRLGDDVPVFTILDRVQDEGTLRMVIDVPEAGPECDTDAGIKKQGH